MNPHASINDHGTMSGDAHDFQRGTADASVRTIAFRRGKHQWVVSCTDQDRGTLLLDLLGMAEDPSVPLGSLDVDLIARAFRDRPAPATSTQPKPSQPVPAKLDASTQPQLVISGRSGSQS